ncbi:DUF4870 domain-containing protein [Halococcus saccharolyticus]|uniref:DUF4870 domain-containing protein n=1 Tax=Halococcus saccharolyticus TaxID=62319 RepID=UPI0009B5BE46|nr:DUF4870 domain-containing protein [Halococcus saccharolyticus]
MNHQNRRERTIVGVIVHLLGLVFGVFAAIPMYILSTADFSKANARCALNWQLFFLGVLFMLLVVFFVVGSDLVSVIAGFMIFGLVVADLLFSLYATYKATTGDVWSYPFAPEII